MAADIRSWQQLDTPKQTNYRRLGEIYLAPLDPTIGREIQKTVARDSPLALAAALTPPKAQNFRLGGCNQTPRPLIEHTSENPELARQTS